MFRKIKDLFRWTFLNDCFAYDRLYGADWKDVIPKDYQQGESLKPIVRIIKGTNGYALVVGKETVQTYSRRGDARRGAERRGLKVTSEE